MADTTELPVKKKRGRKPKVKTEEDKIQTSPRFPKNVDGNLKLRPKRIFSQRYLVNGVGSRK